jgi:hypothetical protein
MRLRDAEKELKNLYETNRYLESEIKRKEEKIIQLNECVQKTVRPFYFICLGDHFYCFREISKLIPLPICLH